jgi:hypothetical protein
MAPEVEAAVIAAGVSLVVAALSAYFTIWSTHRQRTVDLIVAALEHMTGGSQERGAGLAALRALRGRQTRAHILERLAWKPYGSVVGQQLYRQLIYVLNYGSKRCEAHEIENIIEMLDWLIKDESLLGSCDPEQRRRLSSSLTSYEASAHPKENDKAARESLSEVRKKIKDWQSRLSS